MSEPIRIAHPVRLDELIDAIKTTHPDVLDQLADAVLGPSTWARWPTT